VREIDGVACDFGVTDREVRSIEDLERASFDLSDRSINRGLGAIGDEAEFKVEIATASAS
jgi:hypothetical protein